MGNRPVVVEFTLDGSASSSDEMNIKVGSLGDATFDFTGGVVEDVWTLASHGLTVGARVQFSVVGTGAPEYLVSTDYWVAAVPDVNTFTLSTSKGGSALAGTADSVGTWTVVRQSERFWVEGPAGTDYLIVNRLIFFIEDTGVMAAEGFGSTSALTNGLTLTVRSSADVEVFSLTPDPIRTNAQFGRYTYDVSITSWGTGDEVLLSRWSLNLMVPGGLALNDSARLAIDINDDLSLLGAFDVMAEGYRTDLDY